jgi:hypothetical protein
VSNRNPRESPSNCDANRVIDSCYRNDSPCSNRSARLTEGSDAIRSLRDVIQRSHKQHHIEALVCDRQPPRIPDLSRHSLRPKAGFNQLDVPRGQVDDVNVVPRICEPVRVYARPATDIQDGGGRVGQMPPQDFSGPE